MAAPAQAPARAASRPAPAGAAAHAEIAASSSPYVRMHAANAVHWLPWGSQAFAQAQRTHKPIFVTTGFFACFWCHAMDRTVFADPAIARLLNRDFVSVVVDREQRPDLDQSFVLARVILDHGSSGWPNNLVLTPQGLPFAAFGVLPPRTTKRLAGFTEVMQRIHAVWQRDPQAIEAQAQRVRLAMQQVQQASRQSGVVAPQRWRSQALAAASATFDPLGGGFDAGSDRFPHAPLLAFLQGSGDVQARQSVDTTLRAMAEGGIMDQLDGGFHRYAIDPQWSVPHFEKMLSDNAQLLALYAQAAASEHDRFFAQVAQRTAAFMLGRLQLPDGAFASSLSSETGGIEGAPYTWSPADLRSVLGQADADRWLQLYALVALPPAPGSDHQPQASVLRLNPAASDDATDAQLAARITALAPLRERLLAARAQRPQPARDDVAVLAANGLAIAALADAGAAMGQPQWVHAALRAAQTLWRTAWNPQSRTLAHEVVDGIAAGPGLLADDALFGQGLLHLYRVTHEAIWLERAEQVATAMRGRYRRSDGSLRSTLDATLPSPALDDSHEPSAQSAAIALWLELAQTTAKPGYTQDAQRALASFAGFIARAPVGFGSLLAALDASPQGASTPAQDSASVVRAFARLTPGARGVSAPLQVTLLIAPGYHVNANPASEPYLIATSVLVRGKPASGVRYPPARMVQLQSGLRLAGLAGHVTLTVPVTGVPPAQVQVRVQACDDKACLAPSLLTLAVAR
jgi:uncharacterized protein YyaL (SSP411 family)